MGLLDKLKKKPRYDSTAIRQMLQEKGAAPAEAGEIVDLLAKRLSPDEMHVNGWAKAAPHPGRMPSTAEHPDGRDRSAATTPASNDSPLTRNTGRATRQMTSWISQ